MSTERSQLLIRELGLQAHPEGGYYSETYRASVTVLASTHPAPRSASTAVYFLITQSRPATALHRLLSDEVFHLYEGGPIEVLQLFADGASAIATLGLNLERGERPQLVIPRGTWFGTELCTNVPHCLIGCTVAPGFEFADFELTDGVTLAQRYPSHAERIARMSLGQAG
jgi:uncharacterized protein